MDTSFRNSRAASGTGALAGIRVVEVANYVSGPYASMLLGDLGAEVIKIEAPGAGDPFRGWGRVEYSATFGSLNRNKKSVELDIKKDGEALRRLLADADVLIENFRPGTLDRIGLGYDELAKVNGRLIYCSITGFGSDGPYRDFPGYDTVGQGMSGLLSLLTEMNAPQPMGISLSDHLGGIFACYGVLAALMARTDRTRAAGRDLLTRVVDCLSRGERRELLRGR
jgi:crotonobetainyl-CoA:carnitine CoA-transferase CaiB-like acyl-CoA transferase